MTISNVNLICLKSSNMHTNTFHAPSPPLAVLFDQWQLVGGSELKNAKVLHTAMIVNISGTKNTGNHNNYQIHYQGP